jgi:hypothetical protein
MRAEERSSQGLVVIERRFFAFSRVVLRVFPAVSFWLAVLKPSIHSSRLRVTGYRLQTRPSGRGGLPNQCSGPLMTNAVTEPTRQLSLALRKLPVG